MPDMYQEYMNIWSIPQLMYLFAANAHWIRLILVCAWFNPIELQVLSPTPLQSSIVILSISNVLHFSFSSSLLT
jgi:hypothetical protein